MIFSGLVGIGNGMGTWGFLTRGQLRTGVLLILCTVIVAYLIGRWAPERRRHLRRVTIPWVVWLALVALATLCHLAGRVNWTVDLSFIARLVQYLATINLAGLLVFDLAMPLAGLGVANIIGDLSLALAYVVALFVALREGGVDLTGIMATSAVVTGLVGLSLQSTLGNVLGGLALQLDDSVQLGDWVRLENGKEGRVAAIRWRHTVLENRDADTLIVPNAVLLGQSLTLLGKRQGRTEPHRMWVYFNVGFGHSPAEVIAAVEEALATAPIENMAPDHTPQCLCLDFARDPRGSYATYGIRYWIMDLVRDDSTHSQVRLRAYAGLKRAGIPLAVPHQEMRMRQEVEDPFAREAREQERRIAALDSVALFDPLTLEEKARMAMQVRPAPFTAGEVITHQNGEPDWLYLLTRGSVEVRFQPETGPEVPVNTLQAPDFFGELSMMTGARHTASVVALGEVDCLRLKKADFQEFIMDRPETAGAIARILTDRQLELHARLEDLDAEERLRQRETRRQELTERIRSFFGLTLEPQAR